MLSIIKRILRLSGKYRFRVIAGLIFNALKSCCAAFVFFAVLLVMLNIEHLTSAVIWQVLCRGVSGRGDHCTGLHHFFRLFCQSAGHWGYVLKCSDHCVELCRGIGVQSAGAGGCGESI